MRDPARDLIALGAVAGIFGGALRIVSAFAPESIGPAWQETLWGACDVGLLLGLLAVHLAGDGKGAPFFVVAFLALASIVGPDATLFGVDFYTAGASVFALALGGYAIVLTLSRRLVPAAALWLVCTASGVVAAVTANAFAFVIAGVALGGGYIAAGLALTRIPHPSDRLLAT